MKLIVVFCLILAPLFAKPTLNQMLSQMILVTFDGKQEKDENVKDLQLYVSNSHVSGVVIRSENIYFKASLRNMIKFLQGNNEKALIALEHLSDLRTEDGFMYIKNQRTIANELDIKSAKNHYINVANELNSLGVNFILEPRISTGDYFEKDTFSSQPTIVSTYSNVFISAFSENGIRTSLTLFKNDQNITFNYDLLRPFFDIIKAKNAKSVLLNCTNIDGLQKTQKACESDIFIDTILRQELNYDGIIISDLRHFKGEILYKVALNAIQLGVDMLIVDFENFKKSELKKYLLQAIYDKKLDKEVVKKAYLKVMEFKK